MNPTWSAEAVDQVRAFFPGRVEHHAEIDSTNRRALELSDAPALVLAERQVAGRGRRGRAWFSEDGAVMCSLRIDPSSYGITPDRQSVMSLLAALAAADAVESISDVSPKVKWPNDLFVDGRKLSGILVEASGAVVIGIGLNLNNSLKEAPAEVRDRAVTLHELTGTPHDPVAWLQAWWRGLDRLCQAWGSETLALRSAWAKRDFLLGRSISLAIGDEEVQGTFDGISNEGNVRIQGADGCSEWSSGEILRWE
jgi:BirA family biotin operon repressor/biotin-[acetyl-CoA-carboxylase] ligase